MGTPCGPRRPTDGPARPAGAGHPTRRPRRAGPQPAAPGLRPGDRKASPLGEVVLDGSAGEGGGQILRTALALSAATGRPFTIGRIRAGRRKPGLAAQHLASVRAAAATCGAQVEGDRIGSPELRFAPGKLRALEQHFEVGTAGSVSLVLHAMALPLALAGDDSEVTIGGGTHVEWSPPFEFLSPHWTGWMARAGAEVKVRLKRPGYYPKGGGLIRARIAGGAKLKPLALADLPPGARKGFELRGKVVITRLDESIARRIVRTAEHEMERAGYYAPVEIVPTRGQAPGVAFSIAATYEGDTLACFSSLGRKGKPAETVGREAAREMLAFIESRAALDPYITDQLVVPLSLAPGESRWTTGEVTQHLLTNLATAAEFTGMRFDVRGSIGEPGEVRMEPGA